MKVNQDADWLDVVRKTIEGVDYGVVSIVIHNSKVVQVERTQKIRFDTGNEIKGLTKKETQR
ncbi:MAG: YezD family protein [Anaerohalosphaeraceae bacterium]